MPRTKKRAARAEQPKQQRQRQLRNGDTVAAPRGLPGGIDPFTVLVVVDVHKDGTVDLKRQDGVDTTHRWDRVKQSQLSLLGT